MISSLSLATWAQRPPVTLLVDQDHDTRRMYAAYLQLSACVIEEAEDGREALAKAIARRPDILVTETRLPGISGFDLCTLLRNDMLTREIPILVVTGDALDSDRRRAELAGADAVLVKPCLPETLLTEMQRLLGRTSGLRDVSSRTRDNVAGQLLRSQPSIERSEQQQRRLMLSRTHDRHETSQPPLAPPALVCPQCDQPLTYQRSHIGGVSARHSEQWDYFECPAGCGDYQYRQRTRRLRKI